MVNRTLCRYAGSYSFVLLAGGIPRETVDPVGQVLEIGRDTTLATSESVTDLAAAFLGYTVKERRELRRQMGICCPEFGSRRLGQPIGGLAISRRDECLEMVRE